MSNTKALSPEINAFCTEYAKALNQGTAVLFAGAGLSKSLGFVDWKGLLRRIATDLGLDVERESDLVAIAQYHHNKYTNRSQLNQLLIDEFTKDAQITPNHQLIANLPLHTIWTTNYDKLLERAFEDAHKRVEVKIAKENLATSIPKRAVTIYKMHGDTSMPHEAVLTKNDYETYDSKRKLFTIALEGDLVSKTFLFLGFSFTDPNIDYILSRIRGMLGENQRQHYCIMKRLDKPKPYSGKKRADYEYNKTKMDLRINDLNRYSIKALLIDNYEEITPILEDLSYRTHLQDVFVSGSADDYAPLGKDRVENLARRIGEKIIKEGYNLVSGFGRGIGDAVVFGAVEALKTNDEERLVLRPFPQQTPHGMSLPNFRAKYRQDMVSKAGFCVFLCGNKIEASANQTVIADGVMKEFQ